MKGFLLYLLKIILICILISISLDFCYTQMYLRSNNRSKIGLVYNSKPKTIDVVILGSSRANYHIMTPLFTAKGLEAFNFGMEGSKLFESDLILKLLVEKKNRIKNVIIEVDLTLSSDSPEISEANALKFLPYLYNSNIVYNQFENLQNQHFSYFVPFYRFMKYDSKIGFREMLSTAIDKKNNEQDNGGYSGLFVSNKILELDLSNNIPVRNKYYDDIREICKKQNINLIAIMTPICPNTKGKDYFEKVNKIYPEIHNYQNVVTEEKYFSSCGHLTNAGAEILTKRLIKDFFNN